MPIALVLDTNILRQEGLGSRNMQLLTRLACSGEVAVYVPEIVCREFLSQGRICIRDQSQRCSSAITEIGRELIASSPVHRHIEDLRARLAQLEEGARDALAEDFDRWMASCKASKLEFDASADMGRVLDDYFEGTGAFRKPKHREDFPDAIVSASIRQLLREFASVHVAVKDGAFKRHLGSEPKFVVLDSLAEFYDLGAVKKIIESLDARERNVAAMKALLSSAEFQSRLSDFLRQATSLLTDVYLEESELVGTEALDIDGAYGHSLNYAQAEAISEIEYAEVDYITQGHFSIGITIRTMARIDFAASYGAIQEVPSSRHVEEVSMNGDGICALNEVRNVVLGGHVELLFDSAWGPDLLQVHSQYLVTPGSKIKVGLEIHRALIL